MVEIVNNCSFFYFQNVCCLRWSQDKLGKRGKSDFSMLFTHHVGARTASFNVHATLDLSAVVSVHFRAGWVEFL